MSDSTSNRPISLEAVAAKLNAAGNFEQPAVLEEMLAEPRFREVLLYLQFVSLPENYAGGLRRFTDDLLAECGDMLGTSHMLAAGRDLTPAAAAEIFAGFPECERERLADKERFSFGDAELFCGARSAPVEYWSDATPTAAEMRRAEARRQESKKRLESFFENADLRPFQSACRRAAEDSLCDYLRMLCELPHVRFTCSEVQRHWRGEQAPWYFVDVAAAVLRFIERRKEAVAATIAETEITQVVFKWLGKARNTSRAIMISGNSRFGKTEALRAWCAMRPGLARLVNTPASNSESDLLREVAKALGLDIGPQGRASQLRDGIDYVLRHTRLMLIFDESHLIFPVNFSRNTAPARLNWVRRSVMDAGLPCAFCCTPQSYGSAKRRFVKTTGYAMAQFDERLLKAVDLPEELSREDLLAVARIHFPKLADAYLQYVVEKTSATERNYMSDLEKIATLARDNAQEAGRALPSLDDIKAAIADVLPVAAPVREEPIAAARSERPPARRTSPVSHPRTAPASPMQGRGNTPAGAVRGATPETFTGAALRGLTPEFAASGEG